MSVVPAAELGAVHFIGIGGAGMSGIARIMLARGMAVSGSDAKDSSVVTALRALGAQIHIGHDATHVHDVDTIVVSSAIREDNPELVAGRAQGQRIIHRSAALASLMVGKRTVAIAGTHGKTTTTSMTTVALQSCGLDPSFVIGGVLTASGTNAHDGSGDVFIAEADESDGSFLLYQPAIGVLTNAEADHLDHYGTAAAVTEAFDQFCTHIGEQNGTLIACADDPGARDISQRASDRGVTVLQYGTSADAQLQIIDIQQGAQITFSVAYHDTVIGPIQLQQPGLYNALNATAALGVALVLDQDPVVACAGLAEFGGTRRRFDARGSAAGVRVFDDYAHHPTEVTAVLKAARNVVADGGRVHAIFQPHLFSRTLNFKQEFGQALGLADEVVVLDIYPAREDPIPGVTGEIVAAEVPHKQVTYLASFSAAVPHIVSTVAPGDIVLTIGAGDVTMLGPEIVAALADQRLGSPSST